MSSSSENEDLEINEAQSSDEEEVASAEEESDKDEESGAEEPDVNASATESDEDDDEDEVDDDEDTPPTKKNDESLRPKIIEKITNELNQRHEKRKGRQLYVRFPEKLPESMEEFQKKVKALSDLIVEGHKPRQKHARFCLVDFATTEDRDLTLKKLSKKDSKIVVSLPKTDNEDFIKSLIEKKIQQREKKLAKNLLRSQSKKNVLQTKFTPTLVVLNLPSGTSTAQIKELFPDSVDIHTKGASGKFTGKMIATVTLPSSEDARKNSKRNLELGGNKLILRFNTAKKRDYKKKKNNNAQPGKFSKKGPIAPANPEGKNSESPKKSPKKRSISENGSADVPEKKAKGKKPFPPNKKGNPAGGKTNNNPKKQNKQKKGKSVQVADE